MKQKYFYHEHLAGYGRMKANGMMSWGHVHGNPDDFASFSSRRFLEETLPRLDVAPGATVLELGCGTGPGTCFLAETGYRVHGIDIIPDAIEKAREIAAGREFPIDTGRICCYYVRYQNGIASRHVSDYTGLTDDQHLQTQNRLPILELKDSDSRF